VFKYIYAVHKENLHSCLTQFFLHRWHFYHSWMSAHKVNLSKTGTSGSQMESSYWIQQVLQQSIYAFSNGGHGNGGCALVHCCDVAAYTDATLPGVFLWQLQEVSWLTQHNGLLSLCFHTPSSQLLWTTSLSQYTDGKTFPTQVILQIWLVSVRWHSFTVSLATWSRKWNGEPVSSMVTYP